MAAIAAAGQARQRPTSLRYVDLIRPSSTHLFFWAVFLAAALASNTHIYASMFTGHSRTVDCARNCKEMSESDWRTISMRFGHYVLGPVPKDMAQCCSQAALVPRLCLIQLLETRMECLQCLIIAARSSLRHSWPPTSPVLSAILRSGVARASCNSFV